MLSIPVKMDIFVAVCDTGSKAGELVTVEFLVLNFMESFLPVVESRFSFKQHGGGEEGQARCSQACIGEGG